MPTKMIWLLPMWSNAGSRMFPRFFPHLTISLSQAVRDRTGHVAHAALRRRGFLRDAGPKARAQVRWRQVKFSLKPFSKGLQGVGQRPTVSGLQGAQAPAFPYSQKGGTNVPLLGWHRARGFACGRDGTLFFAGFQLPPARHHGMIGKKGKEPCHDFIGKRNTAAHGKRHCHPAF